MAQERGAETRRAADPLLPYARIHIALCPVRFADENSQGLSCHCKTGSARFWTYLPAREYTLGRQNRSAESARSLQDELQPHLVALLRPSRSGDGPAGTGDQGRTCLDRLSRRCEVPSATLGCDGSSNTDARGRRLAQHAIIYRRRPPSLRDRVELSETPPAAGRVAGRAALVRWCADAVDRP